MTGHEAVAKAEAIDYRSLAANAGTIVMYMGVEQSAHWSEALLQAGRGEACDERWKAAVDEGRFGAVDLAGVFLQLDEGQRALDALRFELRPGRPVEVETALMLGVLLTASDDKAGAEAARDELAGRLPEDARASFVADFDAAIAAAQEELDDAALPTDGAAGLP